MVNGLHPAGMHLLSHATDTPCVGERRFFFTKCVGLGVIFASPVGDINL
jgi:hypothetical protein